ncbi:MAG: hypothetical protein HY277_07055 [Ignavibacteriales bacterium]|nr:hypothetical protein [Ignavibacteriales bacterium]
MRRIIDIRDDPPPIDHCEKEISRWMVGFRMRDLLELSLRTIERQVVHKINPFANVRFAY